MREQARQHRRFSDGALCDGKPLNQPFEGFRKQIRLLTWNHLIAWSTSSLYQMPQGRYRMNLEGKGGGEEACKCMDPVPHPCRQLLSHRQRVQRQ